MVPITTLRVVPIQRYRQYSQRRKDNEREKERYFQYTFYLVIRMISCFTVLIEKEQSEGRVDCIVETPIFFISLSLSVMVQHLMP